MRSAALDLAWYQYFLLDVIAILALVAVCVLVTVYFLSRAVIRRLFYNIPRITANVVKKNK
jgi:uncharacterized protein YneF (UPF0154 family)